MAPNHVFKYPKCVQAQKGQYLFIYEAFGAIGMEEVPMRVVINPRLTVTDSQELTARESCCSVQGMSAIVPRAKAVKVHNYLDHFYEMEPKMVRKSF